MRENRERCQLRTGEPLPLKRLGVVYRAPVTTIAIYRLGVMMMEDLRCWYVGERGEEE